LKQLVNNEFDAVVLLEKACTIYQSKIQRKSAQAPLNEQTIFGENTASAIVVISATSHSVGTILHSNEETFHLLGHSPKDLLGSKVNVLMPK
jgi:hypothetical protein